MPLLEVKLPIVLQEKDYHDLKYLYWQLERVIPNLQYRELGFQGFNYYGLFYLTEDDETKSIIDEWREG